MTTTFINALYEPFENAWKKPGLYPVECVSIVQPASVPIPVMW